MRASATTSRSSRWCTRPCGARSSATRGGHVGVIGTAATITSGAYADAFAAAPHIELTTIACPRFVEFVEAGDHLGPGADRRRERVPRADEAGRRRHPRPRLHPLPAAHGRHLLRHGGGRHPGVERRGDGEGRLPHPGRQRPAASPGPARARAPVPGHRRSRRLPAPGPALPRSRDRQRRGRAREAHRRRLRRLLPERRVAGVVLPHRARGRRGSSSTSATARSGRCSSTSTSLDESPSPPWCSATATSTTAPTSRRCSSSASTGPSTGDATPAVFGPLATPASASPPSTAWPTRARWTTSSTSAPSVPGPSRSGRSAIEAVRAAHPGRGVLPSGSRAGGDVDHLLRRHRAHAATWSSWRAGTDIALFEASFVGTDNPPDLHLTGAEAARIASRGRRRAARAHPPRGLERRGGGARRGGRPSSTARSSRPGRG